MTFAPRTRDLRRHAVGRLPAPLRRFAREESGSVMIEVCIMLPIFIMIFLSAIEMGMMTLNQTLLEHGVDRTVRELRIGMAEAPTHDKIRDAVCDNSWLLPGCSGALRLELRSTDLRAPSTLDDDPQCINRAESVQPLNDFVPGARNEMMLIRACYVFSPIFPHVGYGRTGRKNAAGDIELFATTAFVNEPS